MSGDAEKNNYELMNIQNLWLKIRKIMSWLAYSVPILISRACPIMSGDTEKELGVGKNSELGLEIRQMSSLFKIFILWACRIMSDDAKKKN